MDTSYRFNTGIKGATRSWRRRNYISLVNKQIKSERSIFKIII